MQTQPIFYYKHNCNGYDLFPLDSSIPKTDVETKYPYRGWYMVTRTRKAKEIKTSEIIETYAKLKLYKLLHDVER